MKIVTDTVFLDEYDRYEADTTYDVPLEKGLYFVRNGWAHAAEAVPDETLESVDLDIHSTNHAVKDSNG